MRNLKVLLSRVCYPLPIALCAARSMQTQRHYFGKHVNNRNCMIVSRAARVYYTNLRNFRISNFYYSCWKCGAEIKTPSLFCSQCNVLQKPEETNYFHIIGIKEDYEIDNKELTTKFRKLQNILHPDRFTGKDEEERQLSEQYSSLVNKAYSTLAQPLSRGLYMLSMRDVYLEEGITATDPQFLTKILEINEELADAQPDDVKKLERNNKEMLDKLTREAAVAFSTGDINTAKQVLVKMKYYSSFEARIKNLKRESGIE